MSKRLFPRGLLAVAALTPALALAQPVNDNCINAIPVGDGLHQGSNVGATLELGETVSTGCVEAPNTIGASVWWRYTAPVTGTATFDTCGSSIADTVLSIYNACDGVELACDNDTGCLFGSRVDFAVIAGTEFLVRVAGFQAQGNPPATGTVVLNISSRPTGTAPPGNDTCEAVTTTVGAGTHTGSSVGATTDFVASCATSGADVWWHYLAGATGTVTVDTCGSAFDTVLAVLTVCKGTELACDDNGAACGNGASSVSFDATAGTEYFIRVGGIAGATGSISLTITEPGSGGGGGGNDNGNSNGNDNGNTNGNDNTGGGNDNSGGSGNDNTGGGNDNTGGGNDNSGGSGNDNTGGGNDNTGGSGNDNSGSGNDNTPGSDGSGGGNDNTGGSDGSGGGNDNTAGGGAGNDNTGGSGAGNDNTGGSGGSGGDNGGAGSDNAVDNPCGAGACGLGTAQFLPLTLLSLCVWRRRQTLR